MNPEQIIKIDTLENLRKACFTKMHNYSQLIIDSVQLAENLLGVIDTSVEDLLKFRYDIDNILQIVDKTKVYDYQALLLLQSLVNEKLTWKGDENNKIETAIEWFIKVIFGELDLTIEEIKEHNPKLYKLIEQGKNMEKEQKKDFARYCLNKAVDLDLHTSFVNVEKYHNETYKSE